MILADYSSHVQVKSTMVNDFLLFEGLISTRTLINFFLDIQNMISSHMVLLHNPFFFCIEKEGKLIK